MIQKILTAVLVFGLSVTGAQAGVINFTGTYDAPNELDFFKFTNNTAGDVQIVMDTLNDGFDADMVIWSKVSGSTAVGLPESSDWQIVRWSPEGTRFADHTVGTNTYGVALKNGFTGSPLNSSGVSDPGELLSLAAGDYLISVTGSGNFPNNPNDGDLMSGGFFGFDQFSGIAQNFPHAYDIQLTGDVSHVSAVPVPAAVWLFGTAIAGLGVVRRKKTVVSAA